MPGRSGGEAAGHVDRREALEALVAAAEHDVRAPGEHPCDQLRSRRESIELGAVEVEGVEVDVLLELGVEPLAGFPVGSMPREALGDVELVVRVAEALDLQDLAHHRHRPVARL